MQFIGESVMLPFCAQFYFMRVDRASINHDGMNGNNFLETKGKLLVRSAGKLPAEKANGFRGADDGNNAAER